MSEELLNAKADAIVQSTTYAVYLFLGVVWALVFAMRGKWRLSSTPSLIGLAVLVVGLPVCWLFGWEIGMLYVNAIGTAPIAGLFVVWVGSRFLRFLTREQSYSGGGLMEGKRTHYDRDGNITGYSDR